MPGVSYHDIVLVDNDISPPPPSKSPRSNIYLWDKANINQVREDVKHNLTQIINKIRIWTLNKPSLTLKR